VVSLLPAILLSGFIFQIRVMPPPMQVVTHFIPARYYLVILRGIILKGSDLSPYWDQMGYLALFTLASLALASWRLARENA
jgi:ABC-2 type transport system permease protein